MKKTALITGASSGIGRAYARALCTQHQYNVILVARRVELLEALKVELDAHWHGKQDRDKQLPTVKIFQTDLRSAEAIQSLVSNLNDNKIDVDLLVNNAGFGSLGAFERSDLTTERQMVAVNCIAPLLLTHLLVPGMQKRGGGAVINVCSTCSFQPMPYMATYGATKAFLFSLSAALASELKASNVHVMAHCPGPTESEFHIVVGLPKKLDWLPGMKAERVVSEALRGLELKKRVVINGRLNHLLSLLPRLMPARAAAAIVQRILKRNGLGEHRKGT